MRARGVVFEKTHGSCGERLPHPKRVRITDGPHAGDSVCLYPGRWVDFGEEVTIEYDPDDQFARVVES